MGFGFVVSASVRRMMHDALWERSEFPRDLIFPAIRTRYCGAIISISSFVRLWPELLQVIHRPIGSALRHATCQG